MPAAIIPAALGLVGGVVGDISSNSQQKAAQKNNDNQNAAARANTQQAYADAKQNLGNYIAANPAPFTGQQGTVARPNSYAPFVNQTGAGPVASGQAAMTPPGGATQQAMDPQIISMIQQVLAQRMGGQQPQQPQQAQRPTPTMPITFGNRIST